MSYLICFLFTFFVLLSAFGQSYPYQLKGSYKFKSTDKKRVEYVLKWTEDNGKITGNYSDNFFIDSADVKGDVGNLGRNFFVKLPQSKMGVRTISLLTSGVKANQTGLTVPISIVTRDVRGNPLSSAEVSSVFTTQSMVAQRQEEECSEGFGALAGYCGVYSGLIAEDQDRRNRCNLLFAETVKFELQPDSMLILHIGDNDELLNSPTHEIGRLPSNPESAVVDIMSRTCRPLQGVNSSGDTCKQLNLRGEFTTISERKHFRGSYTIKEENTNNLCRYTLSMDIMENQ